MDFARIVLSQTNCYLLKIESGYMLVDCGNHKDNQAFLNAIGKMNIELDRIGYLFLTHHHSDHCGLIPFIVSKNPNIRIIMSSKCSEFLAKGANHKHSNEEFSNTVLKHLIGIYSRLDKNWSDKFTPYFAREGDIIIGGSNERALSHLGIEGRVIPTPGHTEDSISLVIKNVAFVGDAARNMLNFTGSPYLPILLYDLDECGRSWYKLLSANTHTICPAHGKPFSAAKLLAIKK